MLKFGYSDSQGILHTIKFVDTFPNEHEMYTFIEEVLGTIAFEFMPEE